jgi:preprotein translocase subunit YajC
MNKSKTLTLTLITGLLITVLVFIGGCYPTEGEEGGGGFDWTIIIFLVLIFAMFYFLMIRPQRKRQKEHRQMMEELRRGDRVVTAGGIYGTIESVSEDSVLIKVESGATMRVAKGSVAIKREGQSF